MCFLASFVKRKNADGSYAWQVKVRRKGYPSVTQTFDRRVDGERWAATQEADMARGRFSDMREANSLSLHDALERYRAECTSKKKGKKQEGHRLDLWQSSTLANRPIGQIKAADIAKWRDGRLDAGAAPNTVKNDLIVLSHVFTIAEREWGMDNLVNPVRKIKKPVSPPGRERRLIPPDGDYPGEEHILLKIAPKLTKKWMHDLIIIALDTSMRLSELLSISRENTDLKRATTKLLDTKNNTKRTVPLSVRAVATLKNMPEYKSGDSRYFPFKVSDVETGWRMLKEKADITDLHFHDLRHEAISRFFEKGLNHVEVMKISGHKTISSLMGYTHLLATNLAKRLD